MKKWKNILYHVLIEFEVYEAFRSNQKSLALLIATTRIISHPGKCRWVYFGEGRGQRDDGKLPP